MSAKRVRRTPSLVASMLAAAMGAGGVAGAQGEQVAATAATSAAGTSVLAHYIVFETDRTGAVAPVHHRYARLAALPQSRTETELEAQLEAARAAQELHMRGVAVRLTDSSGDVVFRDFVEVPLFLRGEFDRDGQGRLLSRIDTQQVRLEKTAFVVRAPAVEGGELYLQHSASAGTASFAMDLVVPLSFGVPDGAPPAIDIISSGSPANRVDLLIMGDGYTAGESAKFTGDATNLANGLLGISPYADYRNFVNARGQFVASNQSGADHPPYSASCTLADKTCCTDVAAQADPRAGTFADTAFDAAFCSFGLQRNLGVNLTKVLAAAAGTPDWDKIAVIVNDPVYGGSGGSIWTTSTHQFSLSIGRHEHGHSFTRLADEYESAFPGYPPCSDLDALSACEPNVTDQTARSQIKWQAWIADSTPVPTPNSMTSVVGLFQGARYSSSAYYRPRHDCLMRTLGAGFCEICTQAYVLRLYQGGWGVPTAGIDLIEPGSESPPPGAVQATLGQAITFKATLLQSQGVPAASAEWLVNGSPVGGSGNSYALTPAALGTTTVTFRVTDPTLLVKPAMAGSALQKTRTWTVTVATPTIGIDDRTVAEGSAVNAAFRVFLSAASAQTVTVQYATANNTALSGSDYTAASGTLSLSPGRTQHSIFVPIVTDAAVEGSESFFVNLSSPQNATLADAQAVGTIQDPPAAAKIAMYRSYNRGTDYHFFTTDLASKNFAVGTLGFQDESTPIPFYVWNTQQTGTTPLFRMYNPNLGRHFYTASSGSRDFLMGIGALYEKEEGFVFPLSTSPVPSGATELFLLYNNNSGTHLFTADANQKNAILGLFPGVWVAHTSVGYVFTSP